MKKTIFLLVCLIGMLPLAKANIATPTLSKQVRDSIFKKAHSISVDSLRSTFLREAFQQYIGQETATEFLDSAIALCQQEGLEEEELWALYDYCRQYEYRANLPKLEERFEVLKEASYRYKKDYAFYYSMWLSVLQARCAVGDTEYAIMQAKEMIKEADRIHYDNGKLMAGLALAQAYDFAERYNDAAQVYEEVLKENPTINENGLLFIYGSLGRIYIKLEKYPQALDKLQRQFEILTIAQNGAPLSGTFKSTFLDIEISFCKIYVKLEDKEKLIQHLTKAKTYYDKDVFIGTRMNYHSSWAAYYKLIEDWDKSLKEINISLKMCHGTDPRGENQILKEKANILMEMKDFANAAKLHKIAVIKGDSLNQDIMERHQEAHQMNHKIRTALLEKVKLTKRYRFIQIGAGCIILIIMIFAIIRASRLKRKQQEAEEKTRLAFEKMKAADKMKERFLHNITYEIRIPLNTVVGFSELLSSENDLSEEEIEEYSTVVKNSSSKLLTLINNILDLSRLEAGMMRFNVQECDVAQLCREAKMMIEMQSPGTVDLTFNTELEELLVQIDSKWLLKVLTCLFSVPTDYQGEARKIEYTLKKDNKQFTVLVEGSPLYQGWKDEQEQSILHNINRLYIEAFKGNYQVLEEENQKRILIAYPIS